MTPKQEAQVKKAGMKLAVALDKAGNALRAYSAACRDAGLPFKGLDDSRILLLEDMVEYQMHLRGIYDKERTSA